MQLEMINKAKFSDKLNNAINFIEKIQIFNQNKILVRKE